MNLPLPDAWPRVWRGESSGVLFDAFDLNNTQSKVGFFFAQRHDHAASYAAAGTGPRAFVLDPGKVLDLRDPYGVFLDPTVQAVLNDLRDHFDDWTCRYSGDPRDVVDYLEAGDLYDYEGTGEATRWNRLFRLADAHGYDSVCVRDVTDGVSGEDALVWVVFDPARIHADPARPAPEPPAARRGFRP